MNPAAETRERVLYMAGLILAGEAVFALPFHVARFFRSSVLETFGLTNTELGTAQAVYGIIAMLAYFPGGPLADRFPARKLLAFSLFSTAAGGIYLATLPGPVGAMLVWGFFGITTILLFWAALIRATREWGSASEQGRAYGLLDGGRGVLAAGLATLGAGFIGMLFPEGYAAASLEDKKSAMRLVIYGYSAVTAACGLFVWFALARGGRRATPDGPKLRAASASIRAEVIRVLRMPSVWLISLIVICAYVGYKGFDNYQLYAVEGFGLDDVEAARIAAIAAWMRPIAALGAGLLGDKYLVSRMTVLSFTLLLASYIYFAMLIPNPGIAWPLVMNVLIGSSAVFALRALYYALLEEARVPLALTGTTVGIVSFLGYTPDIFVSYLGGVLLDSAPGLAGHQHYFWFMALFAAIGLLTALIIVRMPSGRLSPPLTGNRLKSFTNQ